MKKKSVNLITAVGVLVVLSGAYVGINAYVTKQEAAETESTEEETPEIISIASGDVKSIKFVIDKKEVTFEKDGDSWVKSDETDFPVDQDKIDTLVSSLSSVKAERTLEDVEDASEYELDQPENTITVTTEDGETTVIQIGMENDSTSQEYVDLNGDSSTVYVVSNSAFASFEGTLYDFAKSGTFPTVDSSTVSKISVDGKDSTYVVEKDENNFWNVIGGGDTEKADSAKATSLASALSSMAYASYVNYNCTEDELSQYGLDKPYAEITVDYQEEVTKDAEEPTDEENEAENGTEEASEASEDESQVDESADSATAEETDSEITADDTGAEDAEAESADIATADAEDTESTDDVEEESEPETEMVDRELVIQVGDLSSDGGRYVRVNDSNEIYTISEDSLDTFIGKTNSDFWDLTVSYLSVNNLDTLDVNYGGADYTINVSRETSEDETDSEDSADSTDSESESTDTSDTAEDSTSEDAESTDDSSSTASSSASVTLSYTLNGNDLDSTTFTTFYNKLINMAAQKRLTDEFKSNTDPEMTVKFTDVDGNEKDVEYYSYDANYYAAVTDGKVYLVNKMTVKELFQSFETVTGADADNAETSETSAADSESQEDDSNQEATAEETDSDDADAAESAEE